jgi:hypothetical protein
VTPVFWNASRRPFFTFFAKERLMAALKGLDTGMALTSHAAALRQEHGFDFVMRYYSHNAAKNLSLVEACTLSSAGLQIGTVWESAGIHASFFTRPQGVADGAAAFSIAHDTIGQPPGSAIYFAVDYDASQADIDGPITDYFAGVAAAFDAASGGASHYAIGVYGSGLCCDLIVGKGLAAFSWLSQSTGFAGSKAYAALARYNLIQGMPELVGVDGGVALSVDADASNPERPSGLFRLACG